MTPTKLQNVNGNFEFCDALQLEEAGRRASYFLLRLINWNARGDKF